MSYPENPKSQAIQQMILRFASMKEIRLELKAHYATVADQIERLGMHKRWITDEEERLLLQRRKEQGMLK